MIFLIVNYDLCRGNFFPHKTAVLSEVKFKEITI